LTIQSFSVGQTLRPVRVDGKTQTRRLVSILDKPFEMSALYSLVLRTLENTDRRSMNARAAQPAGN
jgi:hypothetical protein